MKYHLIISGGFAGLIEEYRGEATFEKDFETDIIKELKEVNISKNRNLRDGFIYEIKIESQKEFIDITLDESCVSPKIYNFISSLKNK